jgi:hypothetical protein
MPNFTTASGEVEAVTKIEYYQYLVERLNQGELLGELLPQSAGEISTILSRHDQNTGVTTMGVYQDTVELLQQ